jgi:hypothetical protein
MTKHQIAIELASGIHGGFAAKLAEAWFVADRSNRFLIEMNFDHIFRKVCQDFEVDEPSTV